MDKLTLPINLGFEFFCPWQVLAKNWTVIIFIKKKRRSLSESYVAPRHIYGAKKRHLEYKLPQ